MKIDKIEKDILLKAAQAKTVDELDKLRVECLGRSGSITQLLKSVGQLATRHRPEFGRAANVLKRKIEGVLREKINQLRQQEETKKKFEDFYKKI